VSHILLNTCQAKVKLKMMNKVYTVAGMVAVATVVISIFLLILSFFL